MFGFIKNLGKNNNNFYLELKEDNGSKPVAAKQPEAKPEPANGAKPPEVTAAAQPAAQSTGKKAKAAKPAKLAKENESAVAKPPAVKKVEPPKEVNFATKYLLTPNTNGRRRPGANMNSFLEMAREVKVPVQK